MFNLDHMRNIQLQVSILGVLITLCSEAPRRKDVLMIFSLGEEQPQAGMEKGQGFAFSSG